MGRTKREPVHESFETASGPIPYNMTSDYMFRVILQKNESVLRGLIGALLHLDQREIVSVEITNPIIPGEQIDNKTFVLDINVVLNNNICLNLEMQVINPANWQDRSLGEDVQGRYMGGITHDSGEKQIHERSGSSDV